MTRLTVVVAPHALRRRSGRAWERLGTVPGSLLGVSRPLLARPGRPQIGLGAAFGCPKTVPRASGRVPETALGARTSPRSIFRRLRLRFHGFSNDFSSCDRFLLFILFSALHLRTAGQPYEDCARATKREAKRAGFALRSSCRSSSLLARLPRFTSQVAS